MKALLSPVPAVVLSVALSVGGAYFWFQKQAARAIALAAEYRTEAAEAKRPEKPWDFWTPEMENIARELASQRELFARRESELVARETRLASERKELDEMRARIEKLRSEIDSRLVQINAQEQRNLKTLVATYSKLSPGAVVAIFNQMDDSMVAKILSMMKPDTTTGILEEFSRDPGPDNANVKRVAELTQRMRLLMPAPAEPGSGAR